MNVVLRMNISEMPTACGPCELICTAFCKEWTKVDRKEIWRTKSPNCPIIAILPEGHGRLVDADAYDYPGDLKWEPTIVPADTAERSDHEAD
jgi:hypothetical protein